jgi:hypothetical protein
MNTISWLGIPKYPNYVISSHGIIKNVKRGWTLKPRPNKRGILCVVLSHEGEKASFYLRRLVAEAFVPNPKPTKYFNVRLKDGDQTNCKADNIEWCTQSIACSLGNTGSNRYGVNPNLKPKPKKWTGKKK